MRWSGAGIRAERKAVGEFPRTGPSLSIGGDRGREPGSKGDGKSTGGGRIKEGVGSGDGNRER